MRNLVLKLDDYGISEDRYRELMFFCYQYPKKRAQICAMAREESSGIREARRGGGGDDPTLRAVIRREALLKDCEDVEQAVLEASGAWGDVGIAKWLLSYVTKRDKPPIDTIPCGRRQFYDLRRRFFCALHVRRTT